MADQALVDRLAALHNLTDAPRAELEWLVDHGDLKHFEIGDVVVPVNAPVDYLFVFLSGHYAIHLDRGFSARRVMEWSTGEISGLLPYSRLTTPPADVIVEEAGDVLCVHRQHLPALIQTCPELTSTFVHLMVDRARVFKANDLQDEKMISLGRLAAGLAHELNNPSSAIERSAKLLAAGVEEAGQASQAFGAADLTDAQRAAVSKLKESCLATRFIARGALERADRQDAFADWLRDHGADDEMAAALADTGVSLQQFDELAAGLPPAALAASIRWLAANCALRQLTSDVETAAGRIHDLVGSIKRMTYMDRHTVAEAVDIAQGLRDSAAVLGHKARDKAADLSIEVDDDLPTVEGLGGELNQVWINLIDNALDAIPNGGRIAITLRRDAKGAVVRVSDNGPGIPADIVSRIFDPFFTTKAVGAGTGLGLDIARQIVLRHRGEIDVDSAPGRTEFRVWLPAAKAR